MRFHPAASSPEAWRCWWPRLGALLLVLVVLLLGPGEPAVAAAPLPGESRPAARRIAAEGPGSTRRYFCAGELLVANLNNGAVDAPGIPNTSAGTVPGAFVVLRWHDRTLQLPRTNNAGAPSYTDGIWWWSLEDPDHPRFRWRHGGIQTIACEAEIR